MVKREYMKPAMRVVQLRQQHIICASGGDRYVKGISESTQSERFSWEENGVKGEDY